MLAGDTQGVPVGYLDLEVRIFHSFYGGVQAELRLPWGESYTRGLDPPPLEYLRELGQLPLGPPGDAPRAYGRMLFEWLFRDQVREGYDQARQTAERWSPPCRLRLWVGIAPELEGLLGLRWECLHDPRLTPPGFLSLAGPVSRVLLGLLPRWPEVRRPLRILLATANPPGPQAFEEREVQAFSRAVRHEVPRPLGALLEFLDAPGPGLSLGGLRQARERAHPVHGVVLLARAVEAGGQPALLLADDSGAATAVPWDAVATALAEAPAPYLVFLATPLADPPPDRSTFTPLALPLLKADVQAVLAVQGSLPLPALTDFAGAFFEELANTGLIDGAVAAARGKLAAVFPGLWDWADPVLFTRAPEARWFQVLEAGLEATLRSVSQSLPPGAGRARE